MSALDHPFFVYVQFGSTASPNSPSRDPFANRSFDYNTPSSQPPPIPTSSHRGPGRPGTSPQERCDRALRLLRKSRLSAVDLILYILNSADIDNGQGRLGVCNRLREIFEAVLAFPDGIDAMKGWMGNQGTDILAEMVGEEMDTVKQLFSVDKDDIGPDFISSWTIKSSIMNVTRRNAPIFTQILLKAGQTEEALIKNKSRSLIRYAL